MNEVDPLEGMNFDILNEAIMFGMEFVEESERRQMEMQAANQTQGPFQGQPPRSNTPPPWATQGKKGNRR